MGWQEGAIGGVTFPLCVRLSRAALSEGRAAAKQVPGPRGMSPCWPRGREQAGGDGSCH